LRPETLRKAVHVGAGALAFSLRWLGPFWGALLALGGCLFNLFVLPRIGGRRLWRPAEVESGRSFGIVLYPVSVLLLIVLFHRRLEVAASAWGILAFGDGMAAVIGTAWGRAKLPWNPEKTWAGSAACWLFGTAAAATLLVWTAPGRYAWGFALAAAAAAALLAAALESLPQGLDDNLGVPLLAGLFLFGLVLGGGDGAGWKALAAGGFAGRLAVGAAVNVVLAGAGWAARALDRSGAVAGALLGAAVWGFLGGRGWLLLAAFAVLGSAATRLGFRAKAAAGLAQAGGGRRSARHALANAGVAVACAAFAATTPYPVVFTLAFAAALATAAADTASTEIGQLLGRRAFLLRNLRPAPPGTPGAMSVEGTAAGVFAAGAIAVLGVAADLFPWNGGLVVVAAALAGTVVESLAGPTLERRALLDHDAVNFLNTLVGALAAVALAALVGAGPS
jgi:uncharacterized protein (TIGR00297 family)